MAKRDHPRRSNQRSGSGAELRQSKGRARTRASGVKLIQDPKDDDRIVGEQLARMGLYAAHTLGDGNCLFRALSDQTYGSPEQHARVRADVCNYLALHEARYKAFVDTDEEESWETRLQEMRKQGTYGGHLELSAFANLHQRPIKVIQPGMIYIIGYEDESPSAVSSRSAKGKAKRVEDDPTPTPAPLYIVYHQWEHYSSVRNLVGPHSGPPQIRADLSCSSPQEAISSAFSEDVPELSVEMNLLSKSLPEGMTCSNQQLLELINESGSWEKALEVILERHEGSGDDHQASGSQSALTSPGTAIAALSRIPYREPTPSSTSVTTASSPTDSTAPSSVSVSSQAQIRKISRSHSRSPEPSDSPDEGTGRRLRPRRTRYSARLLNAPQPSPSVHSFSTSKSSSLSSGSSASPEAEPVAEVEDPRPLRRRTRSFAELPASPITTTQPNFLVPHSAKDETRRNRLMRTPASASHSPLGKSTMLGSGNRMSKKEVRQAQRRLTRAQDGSTTTRASEPRSETICLFKELRV